VKRQPSMQIADLFCGAGGTTTGAVEAAEKLGFKVHVTAVNHWEIAVATHSANHPDARHLCASLDSTNPRDLFKDGELDVLLASPECMGHSNARGGKPVNDQSRATAWCVCRWLDALRPWAALIENVPEFLNWAPLGSNGRPLKSRRGEVFAAWCEAIRALGYKVDFRVFCAADYGDPTTRRRLFIQCVRGRKKIVWPHPTHAAAGQSLFTSRPWVSARSVIDWGRKGTSIFNRKRPLSPKTMARIREGAEKFWPEPFVVALRGTADQQLAASVRSVDQPAPTVAAGGNHLAVAEPLIIHMENGGKVQAADKPLPTITTARGGAMAVAEPFLVQVNHGNGDDPKGDARRVKSVNDPLPTVCGTRGEMSLIEPLLLPQHGGGAARPVSSPVPTIACDGAISVLEPFIVPNFGERDGQRPRTHSVNEPLPTVTSHGAGAVVEPFLIGAGGPTGSSRPQPLSDPVGSVLTNDRRAIVQPLVISAGGPECAARPVSEPMGTVLTRDHRAVVEPLLVEFYGNGGCNPVSEPVPTVTTKDRFGLARPVVVLNGERYELDILFRMLQPNELAGAQGFPRSYQFTGTKTEVVKQIGNAVPRRLARALVGAIVSQNADVTGLLDDEHNDDGGSGVAA
jgi:DNA (cytosine-5)-methyltransferase 1